MHHAYSSMRAGDTREIAPDFYSCHRTLDVQIGNGKWATRPGVGGRSVELHPAAMRGVRRRYWQGWPVRLDGSNALMPCIRTPGAMGAGELLIHTAVRLAGQVIAPCLSEVVDHRYRENDAEDGPVEIGFHVGVLFALRGVVAASISRFVAGEIGLSLAEVAATPTDLQEFPIHAN
jgi:hypothetical protein